MDATCEARVDSSVDSRVSREVIRLLAVDSAVLSEVSALARVDSSVETRVVSDVVVLVSVDSAVETRVSSDVSALSRVDSSVLTRVVRDVVVLVSVDSADETRVVSEVSADARADSSVLILVVSDVAELFAAPMLVSMASRMPLTFVGNQVRSALGSGASPGMMSGMAMVSAPLPARVAQIPLACHATCLSAAMPHTSPVATENEAAVQALWDATNEKLEAGTLTREDWVAHLKAEAQLVSREELEAIIELGPLEGLVDSDEELAQLVDDALREAQAV